MVFSSPTFLYVFLPLFLILYFSVHSVGWRNGVLLAASLLFYAWGEPFYVLLLLFSIALNWMAGMVVRDSEGPVRRFALAAGVGANLVILGIAKYADFAIGIVNDLRVVDPLPLPGIALPLGISFYTFQAISYLVDVHRREVEADRSLARVALYIAMFPQLVAGPIVRYRTVAHQLRRRRSTVWRAATGTRIFVTGLAQKVLIANEMGLIADVAFALGPDLDASEAWLGLAAYTLQIYFDFAGYSSMAIGLGLILGFGFPRNFDLPYIAASVTEFWRRWHMSLSRWFRDYLYIPLGGNRRGALRTYANLATVFLLCGLWHGASWNFLVWGGWHGALLIAERGPFRGVLGAMPTLLRRVYLMLAVMLGWVWFRAETLPDALTYFAALGGRTGDGLFNNDFGSLFTPYTMTIFTIGAVLALVRVPDMRLRAAAARTHSGNATVRALADVGALGLLALSLIALAGAVSNPFLYFRF